MLLDFEPGPERPDHGCFVRTVYQPERREREYRGEPGLRAFDPETLTWALVRTEPGPSIRNRNSTYSVQSDASRRRWTVRDARTGVDLCPPFAAHSFDRALAEKRALCRSMGGKSGWARLVPLEG